jgi:hypothetical protein
MDDDENDRTTRKEGIEQTRSNGWEMRRDGRASGGLSEVEFRARRSPVKSKQLHDHASVQRVVGITSNSHNK